MSRATLLVLAAGMGSRYGGLKQLEGVGPSGETIMDYSIYDAIEAGFSKVVFIIAPAMQADFEKIVASRYRGVVETLLVEQSLESQLYGFKLNSKREKPLGTGHALLCAKEKIDTPFAVINSDDFYGKASFKILREALKGLGSSSNDVTMVGYRADATLSESGVVSRGLCRVDINNTLIGVEEHHKISKLEDGSIWGENGRGEKVEIAPSQFVSMNMWGFTPTIFNSSEALFKKFLENNSDSLTAEFYIPFIVNKVIEEEGAICRLLPTSDKWFGVTYRQDSDSVKSEILALVNNRVYPTPLF